VTLSLCHGLSTILLISKVISKSQWELETTQVQVQELQERERRQWPQIRLGKSVALAGAALTNSLYADLQVR
jgi:hypothetical protein